MCRMPKFTSSTAVILRWTRLPMRSQRSSTTLFPLYRVRKRITGVLPHSIRGAVAISMRAQIAQFVGNVSSQQYGAELWESDSARPRQALSRIDSQKRLFNGSRLKHRVPPLKDRPPRNGLSRMERFAIFTKLPYSVEPPVAAFRITFSTKSGWDNIGTKIVGESFLCRNNRARKSCSSFSPV
jgi:hypothetical protein